MLEMRLHANVLCTSKPHSKGCSSEAQRGNALIGCGLSGLLHLVPVTTAAMLSDISSYVE